MKKIALVILLALIVSSLQAQTFGGTVLLAVPHGEFRQNVDNLGYGFSLQGTITNPLKKIPVGLGINVSHIIYGVETETMSHVGQRVDITRTNSMTQFQVFAQAVSPIKGKFRPYLEVLGGGAYMATTTKIESVSNGDQIDSDTDFYDFSWSYGGGAGLLIRISSDYADEKGIFFDLKCRYLLGSEGEYLTPECVTVQGNDITFDPIKSETNSFTIHAGILFTF